MDKNIRFLIEAKINKSLQFKIDINRYSQCQYVFLTRVITRGNIYLWIKDFITRVETRRYVALGIPGNYSHFRYISKSDMDK